MAGIVPMIPAQNLDSGARNNDAIPCVDDDENTLLNCGICQKLIDDPKYLPCIHTFCSKCIVTYIRTLSDDEFVTDDAAIADDVIQCPTCHQKSTSPGFDNLPTNIIVAKLKDKKLARDKLKTAKQVEIQCTNCTRTLRNAVARCVACDDFMCQLCLESHNMIRALKQHLVITIDEFHLGKVPQRSGLTQLDMCPTHKGEVLRFYCQTCGVVMCRDCTVVDHPRPEHRHVDREEAIRKQNKNIQIMTSQSAHLEQNIKYNIDKSCKLSKDVKRAVSDAKAQLDEFVDEIKLDFTESLEQSRRQISSTLDELEKSRSDIIRDNLRNLEQVKSRLDISLSMSRQLQNTQPAFNIDAASAYKMVSTALSNVCMERLVQIDDGLAAIEFEYAEKPVFILSGIGKIHDGLKDRSQTLILERLPGHKSTVSSSRRKLSLSSLLGDFEETESTTSENPPKKNFQIANTRNFTKSTPNLVENGFLSVNLAKSTPNLAMNALQSVENSASTRYKEFETNGKQCIKESQYQMFDKEVLDNVRNDDPVQQVLERPTYARGRNSSSTYISSSYEHYPRSDTTSSVGQSIDSDSMSYLTSQSRTYSRDADVSSNASSIAHKSKWILERSFGHKSNGETSCAWNVIINTEGDIVVTNERSLGMSIFGRDGRYKRSLPTKSKNRDVVIIDDEFYVTSRTKFVRVYNRNGKYLRQFHAVAHASSSKLLYTVYCLAQDVATGLLVLGANYSRSSCISIHRANGKHVSSIKIAIRPTFIAVTSQSIFVVSSHSDKLVHMVDPTSGRVLVDLNPPDRLLWSPSGVCCSRFDDIYVANRSTEESRGIYRFSASGEFLDCVTTVVASPYGLTLTDDDHRMVVADYQSVKVFRLKCH